MKRSLTGVKPTGTLHLGNILGAVLPAIELQKSYDTFYFVANLHALTTVKDAKAVLQDTYDVAAHWLALGMDPNKGCFYRQSDIPEDPALAWLLACSVSYGDLTRAHAFKAAKDESKEGELSGGTFFYPVLMASDIILYDADVVPVGKDQAQHIEMARAAAKRFNHYFASEEKPCLKEPLPLIQESVATVTGLDGRKMSKSYNNGIEPLMPAKKLKQQVMAIVTDSKGLEDKKDPDSCNIQKLYRLFATKEEITEVNENYRKGGYGYGHAKQALLAKLEAQFAPMREKYEKLIKDTDYLEDIFAQGAKKARPVAQGVLERAYKACGLKRP